jgi:hypothetical protein
MSVLNKQQEKLVKKNVKALKKNLPSKREVTKLKNKALKKKNNDSHTATTILVASGIGLIVLAVSIFGLFKGSEQEKHDN